MWLVLKYRNLQSDIITLFQGLYHGATSTFTYNNKKYTIIQFMSGVLQGCPASAFLFNNSLDHFLYNMGKCVIAHNQGIIRACADDIGASLSRLKHLAILHPIFQSAKSHAGLTLKPPKCILVPLCSMGEYTQRDITRWLKRNIPDWEHFKVQDATKLLGFHIGPKAGAYNWNEQINKMKARMSVIQASSASIKLNALTYNTRVVPVTSYIAQLLVCPEKLL